VVGGFENHCRSQEMSGQICGGSGEGKTRRAVALAQNDQLTKVNIMPPKTQPQQFCARRPSNF